MYSFVYPFSTPLPHLLILVWVLNCKFQTFFTWASWYLAKMAATTEKLLICTMKCTIWTFKKSATKRSNAPLETWWQPLFDFIKLDYYRNRACNNYIVWIEYFLVSFTIREWSIFNNRGRVGGLSCAYTENVQIPPYRGVTYFCPQSTNTPYLLFKNDNCLRPPTQT